MPFWQPCRCRPASATRGSSPCAAVLPNLPPKDFTDVTERSATAGAPPAPQKPGGNKARNTLLFLVQATLSVVLVYFVVRDLNWRSLAEMAGRQSSLFFMVAGAASVLNTAIYTVRWNEVLLAMGHRSPLGPLLRQNFVGTFFNNFAPSMLGQDAVKTYYLGRDIGYVASGISVLVDKILGLAGMTIVGAVLIPVLGLPGPMFAGALTATLLFSALSICALAATRLPLERLVPPFLARWSLGRKLMDLAASSRALAGSAVTPRSLFAGLAVVVVAMGMQAAIYAWFITSATGTSPGIIQLLCALCLMSTLTNLPVSVNGIGVREQAHALILAGLGVPLEAAIGLSLLQYVFTVLQSFIGWVLWLNRPRRLAPAEGRCAPQA